MQGISENHIFILLLQLTVIFFLCIISTGILKRIKQPTITGDILIGIFLGPTILGRYLPNVHSYIFPDDIIQISILDTLGWFGLFLVLLSTGIEVDLSSIWKQRGAALKISVLDIIIPILFSLFFLFLIPDRYFSGIENRFIMNFFISVIMTISALPIAIRTLKDLGILKSDMGFLIVSALTINDIIGWIVFTLILSLFSAKIFDYGTVFKIVFFTGLFTFTALTAGKNLINKAFKFINMKPEDSIELILGTICFTGILFGLITLEIGIHSLFGFFIAGIIAGDSKELNRRTRTIIHKFVYSIFVSLFFVNIGLKIDFLKNFDLFLALFITIVGISGRYLGAWIGSYLSDKKKFERNIISIAHTPGGEMHIVVSLLALEVGLLNSTAFVAIIFGAIFSSIIAGPWMAFFLKKSKDSENSELKIEIYPDIFLEGKTKEEIIEKMLSCEGFEDYKESVIPNILKKEDMKCSVFGNNLVVPRGTVKELDENIVIFAKMKKGINWDSSDLVFSKNIFLVLTPENDNKSQLTLIQKLTSLSGDCEKLAQLENLTEKEKILVFIQNFLNISKGN